MPERYTITVEHSRPSFEMREEQIEPALLTPNFTPDKSIAGMEFVCRMGDPDLLDCVVWRQDNPFLAVFVLRDRTGTLLAAVAESALAYSLGLGHFGELTANARYGVDVFENMEEPDD